MGKEKPPPLLIACCIVLALAVCIGAGAAIAGFAAPGAEPETTAEKVAVELATDAANYDAETSTPVIAHITSAGETPSADFYHAYDANTKHKIELEAGSYTISYISPVNADGSIYTVPAESTPVSADGTTGASTTVPAELVMVPADQVTQEQIDALLSDIAHAVAKGDETLEGATGTDIIEQAANNAANAPSVDKEATDAAKDSAVDQAQNPEQSQTAAAPSTSAPAASTNTSNNTGSNTSTQTQAPAQESVQAPVQEHVHNWVPQTETTVAKDAWTETKAWHVCNRDGARFETAAELDAYMKNKILQEGDPSYGNSRIEYETIYHPAEYSTTTVYYCSGCGAKK